MTFLYIWGKKPKFLIDKNETTLQLVFAKLLQKF